MDNLSKKYLCYLINNIAKINELNKALKRKPFYDFMDNLYGKALNDKIKEIFLRLLPKQDDLFNKHLLKQYLDKWRKKANQIKQKEKEAASKKPLLKYNLSLEEKISEDNLIMIN